MTNTPYFPRRLSGLTLVCVCAMVLAWVAPVCAPDIWPVNLGQALGDRAAEQSETTETTDDPVCLFFDGLADLQLLTFSLHTTQPVELIWTPSPPVQPPTLHA